MEPSQSVALIGACKSACPTNDAFDPDDDPTVVWEAKVSHTSDGMDQKVSYTAGSSARESYGPDSSTRPLLILHSALPLLGNRQKRLKPNSPVCELSAPGNKD